MDLHSMLFNDFANELRSELSENLQAQYHDTYLSDTNFDYAYGETPVIDAWCTDYLQCDELTEAEYNKIESALEAVPSIEGSGFSAIVLISDTSGYEYWSTAGDPLKIMVSAEITDIEAIDGNELCAAFVTLGHTVHRIITGDLT